MHLRAAIARLVLFLFPWTESQHSTLKWPTSVVIKRAKSQTGFATTQYFQATINAAFKANLLGVYESFPEVINTQPAG